MRVLKPDTMHYQAPFELVHGAAALQKSWAKRFIDAVFETFEVKPAAQPDALREQAPEMN